VNSVGPVVLLMPNVTFADGALFEAFEGDEQADEDEGEVDAGGEKVAAAALTTGKALPAPKCRVVVVSRSMLQLQFCVTQDAKLPS